MMLAPSNARQTEPMRNSPGKSSSSSLQLQRELKDITNDRLNDYCKVVLENDNVYEWTVYILGPKGTDYEGGIFKTRLNFENDYPFSPPKMRILSEFWHPNVYPDGRVCISILHTPDPTNPEENGQVWTPAQRVETIIVSVISMLSDPNFGSPANIDASVELRKDPKAYRARVQRLCEKSRRDLPPGFEMPKPKPAPKITESYELPISDDELDVDVDDDEDEEDEPDDE